MFDKLKSLMDMQKNMQEIKRQLDEITFETASSDGLVKITMNGSQEVIKVNISDNIQENGKSNLEIAVKDAYNRAIKRSHEVAAKKMKDTAGLNLPGLF